VRKWLIGRSRIYKDRRTDGYKDGDTHMEENILIAMDKIHMFCIRMNSKNMIFIL